MKLGFQFLSPLTLGFMFVSSLCLASTQFEIWEHLEVKFDHFKNRYGYLCSIGDEQFASCMESYQAALSTFNPQLSFDFKTDSQLVLADFEDFAVINLPPLANTTSVTHVLSDEKKRSVERRLKWLEAYNSFENKDEIDALIEGIDSWMTSRIEGARIGGKLGIIASEAFNKTLLDPYHQISIDPMYRYAPPLHAEVGIGVQLLESGGITFISNILPGGPAYRAGLKQFDRILSIDDSDVDQVPSIFWDNKLSGLEGSELKIVVARNGSVLSKIVTRQSLNIQRISKEIINFINNDYGYIYLLDFQSANLCSNFKDEITNIETKGVSGLVLDLRNNPGGVVEVVQCFLDLFLPQDLDVGTFFNFYTDKVILQLKTKRPTVFSLPLAILVNDQSKSGAELFSGIIQYYNRAPIIGRRTHGKGTGQIKTGYAEFNDVTILKRQTIDQYFLPGGIPVNGIGIVPDIEISPPEHDEVRISDYMMQPLKYRDTEIFNFHPPVIKKRFLSPSFKSCLDDIENDNFHTREIETLIESRDIAIKKGLQSLHCQLELSSEFFNF